jgi:hypothetical protein
MRVDLPALGNIPVVQQIQQYLQHYDFHSTAPRCND